MATRSKHPIATEEISRTFDDARIEELAQIGKLPASADMKRFAEGIREAARIYGTDVREPNDNEVRAEVEKLYLAAERRLYDQVAILLEELSPRAFRLLKHGGWTRAIVPWPEPQRYSMYSITSRVSRRRSWSSMSSAAGGLPQSSGQAPPYHRPKRFAIPRGARKRARRLLGSANMAGIGFKAASALRANAHGGGARIFGRRSLGVTSPREKQSERLSCG